MLIHVQETFERKGIITKNLAQSYHQQSNFELSYKKNEVIQMDVLKSEDKSIAESTQKQ